MDVQSGNLSKVQIDVYTPLNANGLEKYQALNAMNLKQILEFIRVQQLVSSEVIQGRRWKYPQYVKNEARESALADMPLGKWGS